MRRESVATQVIPEYGFALLHARTNGIVNPTFSICLPKDGGMFKNPYFQKIFAVIIMLMPKDGHIEENKRILGYLSSRLVENEDLLTVIFTGDRKQIKEAVSKELNGYFNQYLDGFH